MAGESNLLLALLDDTTKGADEEGESPRVAAARRFLAAVKDADPEELLSAFDALGEDSDESEELDS